jgi:uncharacterized repeat protein (TIGR01451 family)
MKNNVIVQLPLVAHLCNIKRKIERNMNKKMRYATALLLVFSILSNLTAQGWLQRYGTNSERTSAQAVARTADNGYIFCGYSDGGTQLYIVKTDPEGGVLATRKYKTADDVQDAVKMVDAGDGNFLIAFATKNTPTNAKNISLYKIRPNGDTIWTKQFGDTNNERIGDIKRLADGNFIIVGTKFTTNGDSTAILKTDPQGQQLFFTTPYFNDKRFATAIAESQNRSILFISFRPNGASDTARLVKLDANGTNPRAVKIKTFGTNNDKFFTRIDALSVLADGNLAILGDYFAKVDTNGNVLWANTFVEFNASPKAFTQSQDGNFAVVGTFDETRQVSKPYFLKINATNGTTIVAPKQIGFIDNVAASSFPFHNAIIPTTDGGFILASEEISGGSRARLMKLGTVGKIWTNEISGRVFVDNNNNCQQDGDDKPFLNAIIEAVNRNDPSRVFRTRVIDSFGFYTIALDSGTYDLRLRGVPPMWSACTDNISFSTDFEYKQAQRSFGLRPTTVLCPQLDVNVSTPFIRACSTSVYRVRYCNNGSATAQNTYVTLQLDSLLNFQNATIPAQLVGKRLYRFDIGSVEVGKCGGFDVRIAPNCGTAVKEGQTLCVKATIYPNAPCFTSPNWSGASLKVDAVCDADSLRVSVQNIGTPSSAGATGSSIVTQDEVIFLRQPINTNTGVPQALPTLDINNGYTYRVTVPQVPNHPGNSRPTIAVEGCRKNSAAPYSLGKVNQFPEDDFDPFVDKECQILRGAAVNNELNALPVGYQNLHKIEPTDEIEYQINFRNRSTDTAFTVAVRDTLSPFLDPASVELGASSHPYRFQMFGENLMKFTFENIKLPPNGLTDRDEAAGFVKFRVKLKTTIPNGARILNAANISMNFGTDGITNETFHTVGQNFVLTATIDPPTSANLRIKVYPNPFSDKAIFEIEGKNTPLSIKSDFSLYDATGRLVRSAQMTDGRLEFERQNLPVGLYVFKIENNGKLIGSGKLMIKN